MGTQRKAWSGWGRPMHRVAGWEFDHRLNGYITTAADKFSCDCGEEFPTPSGYRKCGSCGRAWNSYVIGTDNHGREASLEKVIVREIPVRKDVIVASKRRQAKGKCECWEGYERVPGTKPCAPGSCRKCDNHREAMRRSAAFRRREAARRYVSWCREVGRMPNTRGFRRFLTAERIVGTAPVPEGKHDLDVGGIENQTNPYTGDSGSGSQLDLALDGFGTVNWKKGDRHQLRRRDLKDLELEKPDEDDEVSIQHFSKRRRAELFDITEEGETPKGKGKVNTPTMRKNPAKWTEHKQNGQFTKRWN